ncbi:MAG: hypothetical protein AAGF56_01495 [Pseudomonadota bacterium]
MKRLLVGGVIMLGACDAGQTGGMREFMVIGGRMTFEDCRARGGLIIRDSNTAMVACDPSVRREPVPADEFDNPTSNPVS